MPTTHRICFGDSRDLGAIADQSAHLVVTSPPYWQLKDYGQGDQIGFHDRYADYIADLNLVWRECVRVLHPGCRMAVNIGDQFARAKYYGRYKVIPIQSEIIRGLEALGLDHMGTIIWQKLTTVNPSGGAVIMGSYPYPRNGIVKFDSEYILLFKKLGRPPVVPAERKEASKLSNDEWNRFFTGHWNFPGVRQKEHLAMFPEELPRRLIRMFTFVGETVLDPFLGSGTTSLAAKNTGRNSVGVEVNEDFRPVIEAKLRGEESMFADADEISYEVWPPADARAWEARRQALTGAAPDLEIQADPRQKTFGSRIGAADRTPRTRPPPKRKPKRNP